MDELTTLEKELFIDNKVFEGDNKIAAEANEFDQTSMEEKILNGVAV